MTRGLSVTEAQNASSVKELFDSARPLRVIFNLRRDIADRFRRRYLKGFVHPGSCNAYAGVMFGGELCGVYGFGLADYQKTPYDIVMKADTIKPEVPQGTLLMALLLETKMFKRWLEDRFCLKDPCVVTSCMSTYPALSRYRGVADLIKREEKNGQYHLVYRFRMGEFPTIKSAVARWRSKAKL